MSEKNKVINSGKMNILAIIPARSGSKGITGKNIIPLAGKPLIAHTIEAAKNSKYLKHVIISTDSKKIASIAAEWGGVIPFIRPKQLSQDSSPTLSVMLHALKEYEKICGQCFDFILLLQPTAPLRRAHDIDAAIEYLLAAHPGTDSLISCYDAESVHPRIMYKSKRKRMLPLISKKNIIRRQKFEKLYVRNGAIYLASRRLLIDKNKLIGDRPLLYEMSRWDSINIDSPDDLSIAELIMLDRKKRTKS